MKKKKYIPSDIAPVCVNAATAPSARVAAANNSTREVVRDYLLLYEIKNRLSAINLAYVSEIICLLTTIQKSFFKAASEFIHEHMILILQCIDTSLTYLLTSLETRTLCSCALLFPFGYTTICKIYLRLMCPAINFHFLLCHAKINRV